MEQSSTEIPDGEQALAMMIVLQSPLRAAPRGGRAAIPAPGQCSLGRCLCLTSQPLHSPLTPMASTLYLAMTHCLVPQEDALSNTSR